jgi:GT2 family glycosyltransferase
VDNNSTDGTRAVVEEIGASMTAPCTYLFEQRQGKSYAINTGIAAARGRILAFTDDDVIVDPSWVRGVAAAFDRFDCIGLGGRIIPVWEHGKPSWLRGNGPYKLMVAIVEYDFGASPARAYVAPAGANMAFRKEAFERYGLFRTDLGPCGTTLMRNEDTEFCKRLMKAGETIMYCPDALVSHPVEAQRTRKQFFMSFYYQHGKAEMRLKEDLKQMVCWFGVPRYLFRKQAEYLFRWLFSCSPDRRFYYKLQSLRIAGSIREAFSWSPDGPDGH